MTLSQDAPGDYDTGSDALDSDTDIVVTMTDAIVKDAENGDTYVTVVMTITFTKEENEDVSAKLHITDDAEADEEIVLKKADASAEAITPKLYIQEDGTRTELTAGGRVTISYEYYDANDEQHETSKTAQDIAGIVGMYILTIHYVDDTPGAKQEGTIDVPVVIELNVLSELSMEEKDAKIEVKVKDSEGEDKVLTGTYSAEDADTFETYVYDEQSHGATITSKDEDNEE